MFDYHLCRIAVRGFMVAACLALVAGCIPRGGPAAPVPANLVATAGDGVVTLNWTPSAGATGYHVKRGTASGGPYTQVAAPTTAGYSDSGVTNGTTYYYVVSAMNPAGESENSPQVSATPNIPRPLSPTILSATPGNAMVTLVWTVSTTATGYNVKRATTSGGPYTQLATATTTTYTDSSVTNGVTYYYVISAFNAGGESANSAEASAIPAIPVVPLAPTNLTATPGDTTVSLTWSASTGATSYHVKRATINGGPYTQIGAPTTNSYVDVSLTNDRTYYYVVSAVNSAGESPNSAQVRVIPVVMNPPPTTFGTWTNVTPSNVDLTDALCGNSGSTTVQVDPANPGNLYTQFACQGIWKSTDYGVTWTGPINTGSNGAAAANCSGGITISPNSTASVPTIYQSCLRGSAVGFWRSTDGGVDWTQYSVTPGGNRQDYLPPVVDPYDPNHLVMTGHEQDSIVESIDGGQTWSNVSIDPAMLQNGGSGEIFFVNTGSASTSRGNWLWLAQGTGGKIGTWLTANGGTNWVQVDKNEHYGNAQIYQPNNNGVVFMAGIYSALGDGVLRSTDYGQTWTHEGIGGNEAVVLGTSKNTYSMYGYPVGITGSVAPDFEVAAQPGTGTWVTPGTPAALNQGTSQISVINDGTHNILVGAMLNSGVWRYVEP
jgi:fibronectin type 3 domain-containing protein